jgi:hypothetical protein
MQSLPRGKYRNGRNRRAIIAIYGEHVIVPVTRLYIFKVGFDSLLEMRHGTGLTKRISDFISEIRTSSLTLA